MTSTTSPGSTWSASQAAAASGMPMAWAGLRRPMRLTASARAAADVIVVSGSRTAQMSMTAARSAVGQDLGERLEHGRRPVVRERLVDGPQPASRVATPRGRERRPHRRRVVGVVVEDGDAVDLALELEPALDAVERGEARRGPPPASRRRRAPRPPPSGHRWPCAARRAAASTAPVDRHRRPSQPRSSSVVPSPSSVDDPRREVQVSSATAARPSSRPDPARSGPASRRASATTARTPAVADVGHERRRRRRAGPGIRRRRIQSANAATTPASSGEHVRVVPLRAR